MLFVSFWHMSSENLPHGAFYKRRLAAEEVRGLVTRKRQEGKLVCTARADLAAPYEQHEKRRHVELCQALSELSIPISIDDFFSEICCNVLQFAYVGKSSDLLFVDCCYQFNNPAREECKPNPGVSDRREDLTWSSPLTINSSTITFDLYSMLEISVID
jgi:hypothetical protein